MNCSTCKHGHVAISAEPCDGCYGHARWEAKLQGGLENEVSEFTDKMADRFLAEVGDKSLAEHLVIPVKGYPDGNPKTAAGAKKPDLTVIPPTALLHLATAMMNGEAKYGLYNWREHPISSRPYIAAALRHILAYLDGEEFSQDTVEAGKPVHHLAHVMATCAIVLDAMEVGVLNDNRGLPGCSADMIEKYNSNGSFNID